MNYNYDRVYGVFEDFLGPIWYTNQVTKSQKEFFRKITVYVLNGHDISLNEQKTASSICQKLHIPDMFPMHSIEHQELMFRFFDHFSKDLDLKQYLPVVKDIDTLEEEEPIKFIKFVGELQEFHMETANSGKYSYMDVQGIASICRKEHLQNPFEKRTQQELIELDNALKQRCEMMNQQTREALQLYVEKQKTVKGTQKLIDAFMK